MAEISVSRVDATARLLALAKVLTRAELRAVTLSHLGGYSQREIARKLGRSEGAVESLLQRAKAKVARLRESDGGKGGR